MACACSAHLWLGGKRTRIGNWTPQTLRVRDSIRCLWPPKTSLLSAFRTGFQFRWIYSSELGHFILCPRTRYFISFNLLDSFASPRTFRKEFPYLSFWRLIMSLCMKRIIYRRNKFGPFKGCGRPAACAFASSEHLLDQNPHVRNPRQPSTIKARNTFTTALLRVVRVGFQQLSKWCNLPCVRGKLYQW